MKERILSELRGEYEAQRAANRDEERQRLEYAAKLDLRIMELANQRQRLFRERVSRAFANPERARETADELTNALGNIANEMRERLAMAGLPADYLQPVYRCEVCRDAGYVGEPIREMCECMKQRMFARLCGDPALGIQTDEHFGAWDPDVFDDAPLPEQPRGQRAHMIRVRGLCLRYADSFPDNEKRNMLFIGASGLGKTFMLNCVATRVLERGYIPWKLTAYQLMAILRDAYFERGSPENPRLLLASQLLMIDDLGTEPMQENLTIPQLFNLLNERRNRRLATIVSTNLAPEELHARYTERLASRLLDRRTTTVVKFIGTDVRIRA